MKNIIKVNKPLLENNFRLLRALYNNAANEADEANSIYTLAENIIIDNLLFGLGYKDGEDLVSQTKFLKLHFSLRAFLKLDSKDNPLRRGSFEELYKCLLDFKKLN